MIRFVIEKLIRSRLICGTDLFRPLQCHHILVEDQDKATNIIMKQMDILNN